MMNLSTLSKEYNTKEKCLKHLEAVRWKDGIICPHCNSDRIGERKNRPFYYHCNACNKDFTVLYGTIFEGSKMPLPKWFQLIALMLNAKRGISSKQIQRTLGITYKSAWYSAMRVRCAMIDDSVHLLEGIVEADEAYLGGKPRHRNTKDSTADLSVMTTKRGRGTKKVPVVGFVERDGKKQVRLEVVNQRLTANYLLKLLQKYVNTSKTVMMTDDYRGYRKFEEEVQHLIIKHSKKIFAEGQIHTNTIEGVWSIIKNGLRGQYYVLSKKYLPFYLAEFQYKYNRRSKEDQKKIFGETIDNAVTDEKCLVNYKPKGDVRKIVYGNDIGPCSSPKPKSTGKRGRPKGSKNKPGHKAGRPQKVKEEPKPKKAVRRKTSISKPVKPKLPGKKAVQTKRKGVK